MLGIKTEYNIGLHLGVIILRYIIFDVLQGCYDRDIKRAHGLQERTLVNK